MPKKSTTPKPETRSQKSGVRRAKEKPFYAGKPPKAEGQKSDVRSQKSDVRPPTSDLRHPHFLAPSHFTFRDDGTIIPFGVPPSGGPDRLKPELQTPPSTLDPRPSTSPKLAYHDDARKLWLYHGNSLELLDAIFSKYPDGRFDAIFADPPYFLSNGGITCHAGKMVKVDKGGWDVSRGPELNHEFNTEWLRRCQRVLKPNGTLWVTGTHHVIFSIGYALQQLGFKILNDIAWEKPNPPPNLSCRYFTHSTETVLWAAKNAKSKHLFNYQEMRKVTGKQMKTVWRKEEFAERSEVRSQKSDIQTPASDLRPPISDLWTMGAPGRDEKEHGKHPTQKPVSLVERCLLASTNEGDLVLDPFLGNGTTAVASLRLKRGCVGIELDLHNVEIAKKRLEDVICKNSGGGIKKC